MFDRFLFCKKGLKLDKILLEMIFTIGLNSTTAQFPTLQ